MLQFAYNYPVTNGNGPGRLPCPDTDNNGIPNTPFNCSSSLGRLPWNQQHLNLYDIRDADGERLWYAVSDNFSTQDAANLNSDATGTITVRDQSGKVIYDGSVNGVAAVIIAPGDITARNGVAQDRSVANADDPFDTTADTDPGIINPANYLDRLVGTEDNASFTQNSATDGFILGPVDIQSLDAINDQIIVITAAEVVEVAEKATLQACRKSINDYLALTGNVYPWLYNYVGVADIPGLGNYFPALDDFTTAVTGEKDMYLDNVGRIPSIYDDYFTETDSRPIESKLDVSFSMSYPVLTPVGFNQSTPVVASGNFQFNDAAAHVINIQTTNHLTGVSFVDIADTLGKDGRLTGTVVTPELFSREIYFWDEDSGTTGFWSLCPAGANALSDCNRDSDGDPTPGLPNGEDSEILHVTLELDFNGVVNFDMDYTNAPAIAIPLAADGTRHASITGTFDGDDIILNSLPVTARYKYDQHYHAGDSALDPADPDYTTGTLSLADLGLPLMTLGIRYYPEIPGWAFDNGWQDSIIMAYAADYRPDTLTSPCSEGTDCIQINNISGNNDDKISILAIAGQHDWDDDGVLNDLSDDVDDVFDLGNWDLDRIFDARAVAGNDRILIIEECAIAACP